MSKGRTVMASPFVVYLDSNNKPEMITINYVDEFKKFIKTIPDTWDIYNDRSVALAYYKSLITRRKPTNEVEYSVDDDDFNQVVPKINQQLKDGDKINITTESEEDDSEIDSLYSDADDRAIEYGVRNENFDKLMSELKKSGSPAIKLSESINPRIKVKDLLNHLKNKK